MHHPFPTNYYRVIVIADDDEEDREFFRDACNDIDPAINVFGFASGDETLKFLIEAKNPLPDIIFLDIFMPQKDGWETLQQIKSIARANTIPIVVYSGGYSSEAISKSKELGANFYINKQRNYEETLEQLRLVLFMNWKKEHEI
jgi:DNA-binding NarL/FixJ family response regulator